MGFTATAGHTSAMGVRTRGLDIAINAKRQVADAAARAEAKAVIERWNEQLATSRDMLWSPTIRAALIAGTPWLDVHCPGRGTSRAIRSPGRHGFCGSWVARQYRPVSFRAFRMTERTEYQFSI